MSPEELESLAVAGDAEAQAELGLRLVNGEGVVKDETRGFNLFMASARQGNAKGQFFTGLAYANGTHVDKDPTRAVPWYELSAKQGYPLAQYYLAVIIAYGRGGIVSNWDAAVPLFQGAAEQGHSDAQFMMGYVYDTAKGVDQDNEKAAHWYRKATERVLNQKAQWNLRRLIELGFVEWQDGDPGVPPEESQSKTENSEIRLNDDVTGH